MQLEGRKSMEWKTEEQAECFRELYEQAAKGKEDSLSGKWREISKGLEEL